jgi:hypothetical protein
MKPTSIDTSDHSVVGLCPSCDTRYVSTSEAEVRRDLYLHTHDHASDRSAVRLREVCRKWMIRNGIPYGAPA